MRINFAHINEPAVGGGSIDYAVFDARSTSGSDHANDAVLLRLTMKARLLGLKIDLSALAYAENGRVRFYGSPKLVEHLAGRGVPQWTNYIDD